MEWSWRRNWVDTFESNYYQKLRAKGKWNLIIFWLYKGFVVWCHEFVQGTLNHFRNLILWNYHYGRTPHSHSHCGIWGLRPFADGHFGLLSHDVLMLFFDSLILLPRLVFHGRLLILKDNKFTIKVTSKCKGKKISEANGGLKNLFRIYIPYCYGCFEKFCPNSELFRCLAAYLLYLEEPFVNQHGFISTYIMYFKNPKFIFCLFMNKWIQKKL